MVVAVVVVVMLVVVVVVVAVVVVVVVMLVVVVVLISLTPFAQEISRAPLPHHLPFNFHGNFYPASTLA